MIYLIWWTPRCGKSTVAKILSQQLHIPYIQTDYLASAIRSKMTDEEERKLFDEKYLNDDNRRNNDVRFSMFSNIEQINHYNSKAKRLWQWIKNFIEYAIVDQQTIILEWFHLWPSIIANVVESRWYKVKYITLFKSDQEEIRRGILSNKHPNDRATKTTHNEETYTKIASFIYDFWQSIKLQSIQHNIRSYDMSVWDFHENVNDIVHTLSNL